eukprot:XP_001698281.1 predicted protein [Chlamydomonas reinhardtii]
MLCPRTLLGAPLASGGSLPLEDASPEAVAVGELKGGKWPGGRIVNLLFVVYGNRQDSGSEGASGGTTQLEAAATGSNVAVRGGSGSEWATQGHQTQVVPRPLLHIDYRFNNWYRTFWEESGRRPGVHEVKRWYEDCADACWGTSKPSWEETRTHSKCLRSLEQVRSYFKAYRAAKKDGVEGNCRSEATRSCGGHSQQPSLRARSMSAISAQDDDPPFVMRAPKVRRPSDSETAGGSFFGFATATGACFPTASETTTTTTNSPASKYSSRTQELGGAGAGVRAVRSSSFTGHSMSLASGLGGSHARTVSTGGGSSGTSVRAASLPPLPRTADMQAAQQRSAESVAAAAAAAVAVASASQAGSANQQHQAHPPSLAPGATSADAAGPQTTTSMPPPGSGVSAPSPSQPGQQHQTIPGGPGGSTYAYPYQPGYGPIDPYASYPGYYDPYYSYPYWGYPPPYGYPGPMSRYPSPTGPSGAACAGSQPDRDEGGCAAGLGSAPATTGVPGHPHYGRYPMMPPVLGPHGRPPPGPGLVSPVGPALHGMPPLPPASAGAAPMQCHKPLAASAAACGAVQPPVKRAASSGKVLPPQAHSTAAVPTISQSQPQPPTLKQQQLPVPPADDFASMVESFFLDGGDVDVADLDLQLDEADEAVIYGNLQAGSDTAAAAAVTATDAGVTTKVGAASAQPGPTIQQIKAEPGMETALPALAPSAAASGDTAQPLVKAEPKALSHTLAHGPGCEDVDATVTLRVPFPGSAKASSIADSSFPFGCLESAGLTPLAGKAAGVHIPPGSASALTAVMAMDEGTPLADLRSLAAELPSRGTSLQGFEMLDMPDLGDAGSLGDEMRDLDCSFFLTSPALGARRTVC